MTNNERISELLDRELHQLRIAHRAHRAALDARFFDDENEEYAQLEAAHAALYDAEVCAHEVAHLRAQSSDSSRMSESTTNQEGGSK